MKLLKTYLRNTMGNTRLSNLAILYTHRDLTTDLDMNNAGALRLLRKYAACVQICLRNLRTHIFFHNCVIFKKKY